MKGWIFPKLRNRVAIKKAIQTPNITSGGFDRSYSTLHTVWMGCEPINPYKPVGEYIRGVQTMEKPTHTFVVRISAMDDVVGRGFSTGFSTGFNRILDLMSLKSDYFLFMHRGSSVKGRLFRMLTIGDMFENKNYYIILAKEMEEQGSGYTA